MFKGLVKSAYKWIHFVSDMQTSDDIRREFLVAGVSISSWAKAQGFSVPLVYQVLSGKRRALRGESHRIAVALGLKAGRIVEPGDLHFVTGQGKEEKGDR